MATTKSNPVITNVRRTIIFVIIGIILPFALYYYLTFDEFSSVLNKFQKEEFTTQQVHISLVSDGSRKIDFKIDNLFDDFIPRKYRDQYGITTNVKNNIELFKSNHTLVQASEIPYLINLDELYSTNNLNYVIFLPQNGLQIENSTTNSFTIEGFGTIGILNELTKENILNLANIFKSNLLKSLEENNQKVKVELSNDIKAFTPMDHKLAIFLPILGPVTITVLSGLINFIK
ncbi:hypothetical protein SBY92_003420 [Candida maltosa Xu316]